MSCAKLIIIIVTYGNPDDLTRCLQSIKKSTWTDCDIFVAENAGEEAFEILMHILSQKDGLLELRELGLVASDLQSRRFTVLKTGLLRGTSIRVWLGATSENLG